MRVPSLNKCCVLLVYFSFPANAADRIFSGSLERVTHTSITIRLADGLIVDAVLPAAFAVPYHLADQVEIACTPVKTVYDAPAGLHYHLQLKSLRLLRPISPQGQAAMIESLSWQPGENLLQPARAPATTAEPSQLDRVREVNLDYVAKVPNFVADETNRRYRSYDLGKPWRLEHTVQDEVTVKDHGVFRRNVHKHASHSIRGPGQAVELRLRPSPGGRLWPAVCIHVEVHGPRRSERPANAGVFLPIFRRAPVSAWCTMGTGSSPPLPAGSRGCLQPPRAPLRMGRHRLSRKIRR